MTSPRRIAATVHDVIDDVTTTAAEIHKSVADVPLQVLGEITWLMTQSPRHKSIPLGDLEWLLNTCRNPEDPGSALVETENSLYNYGLPDFSAYSIASPKDQTKLVRVLQAAVKIFEPRLANVRVVPLEVSPKGLRTVRIRIEGLLLMDPAPEHISFDTTLQLTTGDFRIKDEASG